jgi:predicted ATPase
MMSGNILEALREVPFEKATLITSEYSCTIQKIDILTCRVELSISGKSSVYEDVHDEEGDVIHNAEDLVSEQITPIGSSIFFPTFRRIEGGFTLKTSTQNVNSIFPRRNTKPGPVEEGLAALSNALSNNDHRFVSAISTVDIITMLQKMYTDRTEAYNISQRDMSQSIVERIKKYQVSSDQSQSDDKAEDILASIRSEIEAVEVGRTKIMLPFSEIQSVVQSMFHHKGIKVGRLSFGDAAAAINSELMSAGEKQMLSFISYNGLSENAIIFVDEPELSLHVDWQRSLLSTLQRQKGSNQFIIATHSPFIYSKYPDKEINMHFDRGDSEAVNA